MCTYPSLIIHTRNKKQTFFLKGTKPNEQGGQLMLMRVCSATVGSALTPALKHETACEPIEVCFLLIFAP